MSRAVPARRRAPPVRRDATTADIRQHFVQSAAAPARFRASAPRSRAVGDVIDLAQEGDVIDLLE